MTLLQEISEGVNLPIWVTVVVAVLTAIAGFWEKIQGFFISKLKNKHELELKKEETRTTTIQKLESRIDLLERKNLQLIKGNIAMSTALMTMIDDYEKKNPDSPTLVETVRELIKQNYFYANDTDTAA